MLIYEEQSLMNCIKGVSHTFFLREALFALNAVTKNPDFISIMVSATNGAWSRFRPEQILWDTG